MFSLVGILAVGFVVGLLAHAFKPGKDTLGWVMTILLGITGAFLTTYVGMALGWYQQDEAIGWVASVLGAMALLSVFSLVTTGRR